mmetsp:Transcript_27440/g.64319  ORF Transcript_27440/g.64319 Transcript_27440/m.64319 type:complete len:344 (+) Transcript_27440:1159-2190(+)
MAALSSASFCSYSSRFVSSESNDPRRFSTESQLAPSGRICDSKTFSRAFELSNRFLVSASTTRSMVFWISSELAGCKWVAWPFAIPLDEMLLAASPKSESMEIFTETHACFASALMASRSDIRTAISTSLSFEILQLSESRWLFLALLYCFTSSIALDKRETMNCETRSLMTASSSIMLCSAVRMETFRACFKVFPIRSTSSDSVFFSKELIPHLSRTAINNPTRAGWTAISYRLLSSVSYNIPLRNTIGKAEVSSARQKRSISSSLAACSTHWVSAKMASVRFSNPATISSFFMIEVDGEGLVDDSVDSSMTLSHSSSSSFSICVPPSSDFFVAKTFVSSPL